MIGNGLVAMTANLHISSTTSNYLIKNNQYMTSLTIRQQEAENIIKEAKAMRDLQKRYFKSRYDDPANAPKILNQSKLQEKKVDATIERFMKPTHDLFG